MFGRYGRVGTVTTVSVAQERWVFSSLRKGARLQNMRLSLSQLKFELVQGREKIYEMLGLTRFSDISFSRFDFVPKKVRQS